MRVAADTPLPRRIAAGVAVGVLAVSVSAYAARAPLASVALSRAAGADVHVGDVDIDWFGGGDDLTVEADGAAGTGGGGGGGGGDGDAAPPVRRPRPKRTGPAVGFRDVVLTDDAGRVALRIPAARVIVDRSAAGSGGGRVADVELLRPHAYLILDNRSGSASNWRTLAATSAATRFAAGRGDGGVAAADAAAAAAAAAAARSSPSAAATAAVPVPPTVAGVRLRSLVLCGGADVSVATSVPRVALPGGGGGAGTPRRGPGRPLLPAPVHVAEVALSPEELASIGLVERRVSSAVARALSTVGFRMSAITGNAGGGGGGGLGRPPDVQWKDGVGAIDKGVSKALGFDNRREVAKGGTDVLVKGDKDALTKGDTDALAKGDTDALANGDKDALAKGDTKVFAKGDTDKLTKGDTDKLTKGDTDVLPKGGTDALTKGGTDPLTKGGTDPLTKGATDVLDTLDVAIDEAASDDGDTLEGI